MRGTVSACARSTDAHTWVLGGLAVLYAVLAVAQLVSLHGAPRAVMAASGTVSCLLLTAGAVLAHRRARRGGGAPPPVWLECYVLVPVVNCLLRLVVTGDLHQSTMLMLTVVAIGAAVTRAVAAWSVGLALGGWVAVVVAVPSVRTPELGSYAAQLLVAAVLAGLLHGALARRERSLGTARDELAVVAQQFRRVFDHSPVGIGVADENGHLVAVNAAFCRLVGRPAADLMGASDLAYTHPDDREAHAGTGRLIETSEDGVAHLEKRYVRPDGSERRAWLTLTHIGALPAGTPVQGTSAHGTPAGGAGGRRGGAGSWRGDTGTWTLAHVQDVTARHEAEQALRDSERNLAAVAAVARRIRTGEDARTSVVTALHAIAAAGTVALVEPARDPGELLITAAMGADVVGTRVPLTATSVTGRVYTTGTGVFLPDPQDDPMVSPSLLALSRARSMMWQPVVSHGRTTAVLAVTWDVRVDSPADRRARAVEMLADEAALALDHERLLERLELLAHTDMLTSLPNRRAWDGQLPGLVASARRMRTALTVAVADLDHFKRYNDRLGHQAGDELLRRVAAAFRGALREGDMVARWGGEEFAIALPGCGAAEAGRVLDRVRLASPPGQTCSIGYAVWDGSEGTDELLARADRALYEAKGSGRDRIRLAGAAHLPEPRPSV